jgi:hypothetical protein
MFLHAILPCVRASPREVVYGVVNWILGPEAYFYHPTEVVYCQILLNMFRDGTPGWQICCWYSPGHIISRPVPTTGETSCSSLSYHDHRIAAAIFRSPRCRRLPCSLGCPPQFPSPAPSILVFVMPPRSTCSLRRRHLCRINEPMKEVNKVDLEMLRDRRTKGRRHRSTLRGQAPHPRSLRRPRCPVPTTMEGQAPRPRSLP